MKKNIKYILAILLIITTILIILLIKSNKEKTQNTNEQLSTSGINEEKENILVVGIDKKHTTNQPNEEEQKPAPEPIKDASTLTQEIYNMNSSIGTLYIPKTKITTEVYCNPDVGKM